ncbi:hypothetical protein Poly24_34800 [Rosistilla carotiformis]|uniref:Uncharacterized protein n=1 Tax=Rosistilla carotiformis TaxID=2528017 RepID=A0A518JW61_9BACT|nr:hypothetical protein [Rosistilla carotiformis]QDV69763.1 hypothetical protein Poly24_34800 [Rosistilla carotiformis]
MTDAADVDTAESVDSEADADDVAVEEVADADLLADEFAMEDAAIEAVIESIALVEGEEAAENQEIAVAEPEVAETNLIAVPDPCLQDELQWQLSFLAGSHPELQWAVNPSQLGARIAEVLLQASEALAGLSHSEVAANTAAIDNAATQVEPGPVSECTPVDSDCPVRSLDVEPIAESIVAPPAQAATIQVAAEPGADSIVR